MVADLVIVVNVRDVVGGGCLIVVVGVEDVVWKAATKEDDVAAEKEDAVAEEEATVDTGRERCGSR